MSSNWISRGAAVALIGMQWPALAATVQLDPRTLASLGRVDERFQSYNVEMAEIIGGRFWKPYAHITAPPPAREGEGEAGVGNNPNLFEARPEADLGNRRLRVLAKALGPAYIRVSGSWANTVYFQDDDGPRIAPPPGYQNVLTRAQWRGVIDFAQAVDAKLVTSFAINAPVRDAAGVWTPVQARPFVAYTRSIGGDIYAAELFNEPNFSVNAGGPKGYDGAAYARDSAVFQAFVAQAAPRMKIAGPGDTMAANIVRPPSTAELLSGEPRPHFDIFSYHYYGGVSQRCAPPTKPPGVDPAMALSEAWLAGTDGALQPRKPLRDRYAPGAPIWLTETAGAACGGAPWHATFLDSFRYLDQMARLAKQGVDVIMHNTLAASEYGLIDSESMTPRPNYWAALLWRRLMGPVVLDAGEIRNGFHVYAHCLRDRRGGVSVLAINNGDAPATFEAPLAADLYILSAPTERSATVQLNGKTLALEPNDRLPKLQPQHVRAGAVTIAPRSIGFIALPSAGNAACN
jgi:hypothetical protein